MFFPLYCIKPFKIEDDDLVLRSGVTQLIDVIYLSDYQLNVLLDMDHNVLGVEAYILPKEGPALLNKLIKAANNDLWLFTTYRNELFWLKNITESEVQVMQDGPYKGFTRVKLPWNKVILRKN